jgi:translation elongation factor EF-1beta
MLKNESRLLSIASLFLLFYFTLKFVISPVVQTGIIVNSNFSDKEKISIDNIKVPELTFPEIILIVIILLFQPQAANIFESLKVSPQGLDVKFNALENKVNENKKDIYRLQQRQINEINKLQQFMYRLILTSKEIEKLNGLKKHDLSEFYVNKPAAEELRRLRDSMLISVLPPHKHISDLEKLSNYGSTPINLNQCCDITESGKKFLDAFEIINNSIQLDTPLQE